jgi:hypothetical protein
MVGIGCPNLLCGIITLLPFRESRCGIGSLVMSFPISFVFGFIERGLQGFWPERQAFPGSPKSWHKLGFDHLLSVLGSHVSEVGGAGANPLSPPGELVGL